MPLEELRIECWLIRDMWEVFFLPVENFEWFRHWKLAILITDSCPETFSTFLQIIHRVNEDSAGDYECIAENKIGRQATLGELKVTSRNLWWNNNRSKLFLGCFYHHNRRRTCWHGSANKIRRWNEVRSTVNQIIHGILESKCFKFSDALFFGILLSSSPWFGWRMELKLISRTPDSPSTIQQILFTLKISSLKTREPTLAWPRPLKEVPPTPELWP